ncbi:MAG TPA: hypothetical protein VML96_00255 [Egibacteraceae bacterium]|nr:hypothetical protein [Egibacteraceae bacterium]
MTVLVGTDRGLQAFGGAGGALLDGREVVDVAAEKDRFIALVEPGMVLAGAPPDEDWELVAQRPVGGLTCLLPTRAGLLIGGDGAHLFRAEGQQIQRITAFDEVEGRDAWYTPWRGPPAVRSLAEAPDGALLANVHVGGILRSSDGGQSWEPTIDIDRDVHQVAVAPAGDVLAACGVGGLGISDDAGRSWTFQAEGLDGEYCRAVAVTDRAILVTASAGPFAQDGALYRRALDGGPLERVRRDLPERAGGNIDTGWLAAAGADAAVALPDGSVFGSEDGGDSWSRLGQVGRPRAVALSRRAPTASRR